jgi:hypothetical protein
MQRSTNRTTLAIKLDPISKIANIKRAGGMAQAKRYKSEFVQLTANSQFSKVRAGNNPKTALRSCSTKRKIRVLGKVRYGRLRYIKCKRQNI